MEAGVITEITAGFDHTCALRFVFMFLIDRSVCFDWLSCRSLLLSAFLALALSLRRQRQKICTYSHTHHHILWLLLM